MEIYLFVDSVLVDVFCNEVEGRGYKVKFRYFEVEMINCLIVEFIKFGKKNM